MRRWIVYSCFIGASCGTAPEKKESIASYSADTVTTSHAVAMPTDTDVSFARDTATYKPKVTPPITKPSGTYQFLLPAEGGKKILHTVAFYPGTFRLQEEYNRDSIVVTEGTWAPTRDFIWLYKDQVVRSRYTWKGDTLQYYSPRHKKTFSMHKRTPVTTNAVWQAKKKQGQKLYGVGTEPFWSIEINRHDSLIINMPDWNAPLQAKITEARTTADSAVFNAASDSLRLVVYPYFCSDGMSDFLYTRKLALHYKGQTYAGCGEFLQAAH